MATATAQAPNVKAQFEDAIENGVHAAKRAYQAARRRADDFADLKEEAIHRVRREPFKTAGIALGIGVALGMCVGWFAASSRRHE